MNKRPIAVTIVGFVFILIGVGSLFKAIWPLIGSHAIVTAHELLDSGLVTVTGLMALVAGIFMLGGANWARWLCIFWMAFHVAISIFHPPMELIMHSSMMVILLGVLFYPKVNRYFQQQDQG